MSEPAVAVVDAQTPGNVGTVARAMKNFGFADLYLVDPPDLPRESEAYGYAGHAREDVLPNATTVAFDDLVRNFHTVGFTAVTSQDGSKTVRFPFKTPAELREALLAVETDTCLVFGREDSGLTNEELARLDEVAAIPASEEYPALNLGQAATVTLYELRRLAMDESQLPDRERSRADEAEIERFYDSVDEFLDLVDHPPEKRAKTLRLVRRFVGRAHPTTREVYTLHGLLRRAKQRIRD